MRHTFWTSQKEQPERGELYELHCYEIWERVVYGGMRVEYYNRAELDKWIEEAEAFLASRGL